MLVDLTHPFLWQCKKEQKNDLFKNCIKVNTFLSNIEKVAKNTWNIENNNNELEKKNKLDQINSFKGKSFELLVESLIKLFPCDKRLGLITDYKVEVDQDVGVDGYGISGYNGRPITVQCKYRQSDHILEANKDHLTNFTSASFLHYGVENKPDSNNKLNMIIFTSGDSLNFFTDHKMFDNKIHIINRKDLRSLLDDNPVFWNLFNLSWEHSLKKIK